MGACEDDDKKLTEDPCLECDNRETCISYFDGTQSVTEGPESVGGRSLLHQIIKQCQESNLKYKRLLAEQKQTLEKLEASENKYRELYKNARACLYRTRISDGMLLDCSRATARLFGYANEDQYKENFSVTNTYVDPQQRQALIEALTKDKRVHGFELQLKRKDGTALWVTMSAEIFPEQDFIEGAMRDITVTKVLTNTEKDILKLLMQGLSNKEIAFQTGRSVRTIEDHRAHIMQKLNVDNIVDLTQKALNLPNHHTEE